jgi:hypothetical protein
MVETPQPAHAADAEIRRPTWSGILRIRWPLVAWLLVVGGFNLWNFLHYQPQWGYDGVEHVAAVKHLLSHLAMPTRGYASTNPPAYYAVAALFLYLSGSLKVVQFLSLILYSINLALLARLLWQATENPWLRWGLLTLFALLPPHLAYAYMVFNYSLSTSLAILSLFLMRSYLSRPEPTLRRIVLVAIVTGVGILTALSNLFLIPTGICLAILGAGRLSRRALAAFLFVAVAASVVAPYAILHHKTTGCFLCTGNRIPTRRSVFQVYPREFYYHVSATALELPFYPHHHRDGLWPILYHTLFGDYYGYLVPERLTDATGGGPGLVSTGRHFIDSGRIGQLNALSRLALPIGLLFLAATVSLARKSFCWLRGQRTPLTREAVLSVIAGGAIFCQFLLYIHRYPNYVNIHSGYLFPGVFLLCAESARLVRGRLTTAVVATTLAIYCGAAYWTFILV